MLILGRIFRFLALMLVLAGVSLPALAQQQRVEVQLSAQRVSIDESVILSIRAYSIDAELDASALGVDFDVTQRSSSRQITIENGKRTSVVEWVLELIPKRTGALIVAPVIVGPAQSRPLTVLVEQPPSGVSRDLYIESSVDVSDPYVQAQVIYTLRVFQDVRFLDASLTKSEVEGALMQQLGEERNYQENVNGRAYTVSEIRYSVFPQRSGKLTIPSPILKAVVAVNKNQVPNTRTRTRTLTRRTGSIELNVRPRPDGLDGSWWLPAKEVKLQSEWTTPTDELVVDQPVTRTIYLMAQGAADSQLPQLLVPEVDNISIYADSPSAATSAGDNGLLSQQTNTWAVIPQVAGELVLPEVRIDWFDTKTGEARVAILPSETLTVSNPAAANSDEVNAVIANQNAAGGGSNDGATALVADQASAGSNLADTDALVEQGDRTLPESASNTQSSSASDEMMNVLVSKALSEGRRWRTLAITLMAGWLLSLLGIWFWWRSKRASTLDAKSSMSSATESDFDRFRRRAGSKASLEPVKIACESGDASIVAQKVLAWGAMVWPKNQPTHITEVANRLQHQPLTELFEALDAVQYRSAGSVKPVAVDAIPGALKTAIDQYSEPEGPVVNSNALPAL